MHPRKSRWNYSRHVFLFHRMDEQPITDPAERLIEILRQALTTPVNQSFLTMWRHAFDEPQADVIKVYEWLSLVRQLVDDVERGIKAIPDIRHDVFLKFLPQLRSILSRENLGEAWQSHRVVLEMIINALEFASERLQHNSPEPKLPDSELESLRAQAREMLDALNSSTTIPRSLKLLLFDLVSSIERSINEYRFRGIRGVRQQLFVVASQIQEHLPEFEQNKEVPEVRSFWKFIKHVDSVSAVALRVKELITSVGPMLGQAVALIEQVAR